MADKLKAQSDDMLRKDEWEALIGFNSDWAAHLLADRLREARRELAMVKDMHEKELTAGEQAYDIERTAREKAEAVIESVQSNLNNVAALHGERLAVPRFQSDEDEHELDKRVEWVIGRWIVAEAAEARAGRFMELVESQAKKRCFKNHKNHQNDPRQGPQCLSPWCLPCRARAALEERDD